MKIPATIGILTYNSDRHLGRALASVQEFADIVIADGGSSDRTLQIARTYGARIISQTRQGQRIEDYAQERNRLLGAAQEPWFFYLDSDEIMSRELAESIRAVVEGQEPYGAYRVRYAKTSPDAAVVYRTYKEYYQVRLVRTDIGARFERPVHERIAVPPTVAVGQIEAPWYVPLEAEDLSLRSFVPKAWERTKREAEAWQPEGIAHALTSCVGVPLVRILKSLIKMLVVMRYGARAIPMRYEALRIVYTLFLSIQLLGRLYTYRKKV